jgi:hypothetical protein
VVLGIVFMGLRPMLVWNAPLALCSFFGVLSWQKQIPPLRCGMTNQNGNGKATA